TAGSSGRTRSPDPPGAEPGPVPQSPSLRKIDTSAVNRLATTASTKPSRLKSPTATAKGVVPAANWRASWSVPSAVARSTLRLLLELLAVATSNRPSPLKSASATDQALVPEV